MENGIIVLETSTTTAALDEALAKAQGEIEAADKDKVNPAFRSKYADLTSVWNACRAPLAKHSIAVTQWPLASADGRLHIVTRLAHKGEWMQARFSLPLDKPNAHGVGSAITYAKRFTLSAALGIVADDDDDGNAAVASYKPAAGSAGGGTDFRAAGNRQSSENGRRMAADDPHLVDAGRQKGTTKTTPPDRNSAAAERAKTWADNAIQTLNLSDHTVDSLSRFLSENDEKIKWLESNAPLQHDRFFTAYDYAAERARAKVPA